MVGNRQYKISVVELTTTPPTPEVISIVSVRSRESTRSLADGGLFGV